MLTAFILIGVFLCLGLATGVAAAGVVQTAKCDGSPVVAGLPVVLPPIFVPYSAIMLSSMIYVAEFTVAAISGWRPSASQRIFVEAMYLLPLALPVSAVCAIGIIQKAEYKGPLPGKHWSSSALPIAIALDVCVIAAFVTNA